MDRDVIEVEGPEAPAYLQGQLSQDILALGPADSAWSWLLAPNGKVDALVRVVRTADDRWLLDTDGGWGEAVISRLNRFKVRTKVDIGPSVLAAVAFRSSGPLDQVGGFGGLAVPAWPGVSGLDVYVPDPPPAGERTVEEEVERILAGQPRMGAELTEKTIPAETGIIDLTASFSKGCYTGQELVARVDSRGGNVPRHLRLIRSAGEMTAGSELWVGDQPAGVVTSAVDEPGGGTVGLGYVKRAFDGNLTATAGSGGPPVSIEVIAR
jgi:folate-binding protein YgfZ